MEKILNIFINKLLENYKLRKIMENYDFEKMKYRKISRCRKKITKRYMEVGIPTPSPTAAVISGDHPVASDAICAEVCAMFLY